MISANFRERVSFFEKFQGAEEPRASLSSKDGLTGNPAIEALGGQLKVAPVLHAHEKKSDSATGPSIDKLVGVQSPYTTRSGREYVSVHSLPEAFREQHLNLCDPVRLFRLTDDTRFWRVMKEGRVVDGTIEGNVKSMAKISNHLALKTNPQIERIERLMPNSTQEEQERLKQWKARTPPLIAVEMTAKELPTASLNVMFGDDAARGAATYGRGDSVLVEFTLGALREAGGGEVFLDTGAVINSQGSRPFIVTLPEGKRIPVTVLKSSEPKGLPERA